MPESDATALEPDFQAALALHRRGQLAEAERAYLAVVRHQPSHFEAWYLLGVAALQTGRFQRAAELLGNTIALNPGHADAQDNRGIALAELGRHDEALACFAAAIALRPNASGPYYHRAIVLVGLERFAEALPDYDRVVTLEPGNAAAHNNRGGVLLTLGRAEDAVASCERAIALQADYATAYFNRANALRELQRPEAALTSYDSALSLDPNFADAHNNRGDALRDLNCDEAAVLSYDNAIAARPDNAAYHNNRGATLLELGLTEAALLSCERAIALNPAFADAHDNLGNVLRTLGNPEEALRSFDTAIRLRPGHASTLNNAGVTLLALGRVEDALSHWDKAIALKPDLAGAHLNRSLCHLSIGEYERGWKGFEWRWEVPPFNSSRRKLPGPAWLGDSPIDGRTILVYGEQGFGDTLQFCRYIPMLTERATVILDVAPELHRLLSGLDGGVRFLRSGDPLPEFDTWTAMMSLPGAFRTTLPTIPVAIPYLHADPEQSRGWRDRLAALPGRKVGLVWAGSPRPWDPRNNAIDRRRSITLNHFAPLATVPGLCLISLQKGGPAAQARTPPEGMILHDWTEELNDYADTAALIDALDLVISVDTSVVHLAGALGKPVWVLNRYDQCWRWLRNRTDSPWYPSARLFRQRAPHEWSDVIREVAGALLAAEQ